MIVPMFVQGECGLLFDSSNRRRYESHPETKDPRLLLFIYAMLASSTCAAAKPSRPVTTDCVKAASSAICTRGIVDALANVDNVIEMI